MNLHEDQFQKDLSDIPPVPDGMFEAIENRIRHRKRTVRMVWSLAAGLLLLVTGFTSFGLRGPQLPTVARTAVQVQQPISDDALGELQRARDYLNGDDVADEVAVYAVAYDE